MTANFNGPGMSLGNLSRISLAKTRSMQVFRPAGTYKSQQRFSMCRRRIMDPIRFEQDLRVTIQALGARSGGRFPALQVDIASVAFWYQTLPTVPFPALLRPDELEII